MDYIFRILRPLILFLFNLYKKLCEFSTEIFELSWQKPYFLGVKIKKSERNVEASPSHHARFSDYIIVIFT